MIRSSGISYEVVPSKQLESDRRYAGGIRPRQVSRVAESRTVTHIDTKKGRRRVPYTPIPKDYVIYGRKNNVRILSEAPTPGVLAWMKNIIGIRERQIGLLRPDSDDSEGAAPELVVSEQDRIPLGRGDYAFMGDGSVMSVDGERPLVEEYVQSQPKKFAPST
ncbi:MAG TPA: hypothetical protein VFX86_01240 [Candidatus Saccharimonadales bacterium]|nr:hypothetical protein [Candidatus Saccharimonadales bacterium]